MFDIERIQRCIANREPRVMDVIYRYSVLIPMIDVDGQWEIIYQVRSKNLNRQPGEISFPGGGVEDGETYEEAAIRETMEELNMDRGNIDIVGGLDYIVSYSNSIIHSFLGIIDGIDLEDIVPCKDEVDSIFTIPLDLLAEVKPKTYYIDIETSLDKDFPYDLIPNGREYNWQRGRYPVYFYVYEDRIIWGHTAKITKYFIDIIKGC
ncbi:MAG: CoA pyrophosphatase [Tissierellia bacterium]|nr:CoA pyrophosphatase [Tissierellia bacterium]